MMSRRCVLLVVAALVAVCFASAVNVSAQSCLNEDGVPVDWFVAVKMPKKSDNSDPNVAVGLGYMYGDVASYKTPAQFWKSSSNSLGGSTGAIASTLQQIYDGASSSNNGYIMYNDEIPNGATSDSFGHTKGQMMWSTSGKGFWLIHSVPKLADSPANTQTYSYPTTGVDYGQSFLCISMNIANIDAAFQQMQYSNPQVYGSQWVAALTGSMPNGNAFLNSGTVIKSAASNIKNIQSLGGMTFTHFAKTSAWDQSIFGNLIGPYYSVNMVVETWMRPYEGPSTDTQKTVYSVRTLTCPPGVFSGLGWKESEDHAKWGIAQDRSYTLVCIGDINHQLSQYTRSGGMACIKDKVLHSAYAQLITSTDENGALASQEEGLLKHKQQERIAMA